jgi:RecA-family ATPase
MSDDPDLVIRRLPPAGADLLATTDAGAWEGREPPARREILKAWLLLSVVHSLNSFGGVGKSLLGQQLGTCTVAGHPFLGLPILETGPVLYLSAEDDLEELHRRQSAIMAATGIPWAAIRGRLHFVSLAGAAPEELALGTFERRMFRPGPALARLERTAAALGAILIIIDNRAQVFVGDLNDNAEVTAFMNALTGLAKRTGAAVLLVSHRPKDKSHEFQGAMAWENAARVRWFLERDGEDSEVRILRRSKSNYSKAGEELRFVWSEGAFALPSATAPGLSDREALADLAFLSCLDAARRQQRAVSASIGPGFAPKIFTGWREAQGFDREALRRAMERLLSDGLIVARAPMPWRDAARRPVFGLARAGA